MFQLQRETMPHNSWIKISKNKNKNKNKNKSIFVYRKLNRESTSPVTYLTSTLTFYLRYPIVPLCVCTALHFTHPRNQKHLATN
jgi:hypothetical protein